MSGVVIAPGFFFDFCKLLHYFIVGTYFPYCDFYVIMHGPGCSVKAFSLLDSSKLY